MKQYFLLWLIGTLFLCISCKKEVLSRGKMIILMEAAIDKNQYDILELSDFASLLEYVPFETNSESLFSSLYDLRDENIYYNGGLFIFPFTDNVLKFDENGNFFGKIGSEGQGPGEYIGVWSMDVDEKSSTIYLLNRTNSLIRYSIGGNYLNSINLNKNNLEGHFQRRFQLMNDNLFVFDLAVSATAKYMISFCDSTSTILSCMKTNSMK